MLVLQAESLQVEGWCSAVPEELPLFWEQRMEALAFLAKRPGLLVEAVAFQQGRGMLVVRTDLSRMKPSPVSQPAPAVWRVALESVVQELAALLLVVPGWGSLPPRELAALQSAVQASGAPLPSVQE